MRIRCLVSITPRRALGVLAAILPIMLGGCATTSPDRVPTTSWDLWTTRGAGGVVVGTFDETLCSDMVQEFGARGPCRRVRVLSDPRHATSTLWLARFQLAKSVGADGPEVMMGHASEASCLLVLERAMVRGMVLVADCRPLGLAPATSER
jgi:hypothetical protein